MAPTNRKVDHYMATLSLYRHCSFTDLYTNKSRHTVCKEIQTCRRHVTDFFPYNIFRTKLVGPDPTEMDNLLEVVKKYKCSVCSYLLTVPPVMFAISDKNNVDALYKCGRCKGINCETYRWARNCLFEAMVQNLSLPCCHPQCTESSLWGRIEQHEGTCNHQTIKCPLSSSCESVEEMLINDFGEHITDRHGENVKTYDTFTNGLDVVTMDDYTFFVERDNQYFVVYIRQLSRIAVMSTRYSKYTKFNVKLKLKADDNFAVSVDNLPISRYNNNIHQMNTKDFMFNLKNDLINILSEHVLVYITFTADDPPEFDEGLVQFNVEATRRALTCPYCTNYMKAPIFSCLTGHTICEQCKSRLERCPTCQAYLDGPRLYTLEEMADDAVISCQFTSNGCRLVGNLATLRTHELECSFND